MPALGYPNEWHRFEITVDHDPDGARVRVAGELDIATAPKLHRVLDRLANKGDEHLLLDLDGVEFVDSRGMEAIAHAQRSANQHASRLTIRYRARQVERFFEITGMLD